MHFIKLIALSRDMTPERMTRKVNCQRVGFICLSFVSVLRLSNHIDRPDGKTVLYGKLACLAPRVGMNRDFLIPRNLDLVTMLSVRLGDMGFALADGMRFGFHVSFFRC